MEFSRQGYWNGFPCPPPWNLTNPGTEPASLTSPELVEGFFTTNTIWEAQAHSFHILQLHIYYIILPLQQSNEVDIVLLLFYL